MNLIFYGRMGKHHQLVVQPEGGLVLSATHGVRWFARYRSGVRPFAPIS